MKEKKILYSAQLPTVLFEMFQQRVMDYHFYGVGDVMNYLMESYCRLHSGQKVSKTIKRVFSHRDESWSRLFRYDEKSLFAFQSSQVLADKMNRIATDLGYSRRNRLNCLIIGAFVSSAHVTLRNLSKEMDVRESVTEIKGTMVATYVSNYQYVFLNETAKNQHTSVMALLDSVVDVFLQMGNSKGYYLPDAICKIAECTLAIKGCTTKEFRRGKAVAISVSEEKSIEILRFMRKHGIRTPREFLRRVVLFFLEARYLLYKNEVVYNEESSNIEETAYDDYLNEQYARKDFARSLYMKN